jgi:hypothetical protein
MAILKAGRVGAEACLYVFGHGRLRRSLAAPPA